MRSARSSGVPPITTHNDAATTGASTSPAGRSYKHGSSAPVIDRAHPLHRPIVELLDGSHYLLQMDRRETSDTMHLGRSVAAERKRPSFQTRWKGLGVPGMAARNV
jgi:hypothetical protein